MGSESYSKVVWEWWLEFGRKQPNLLQCVLSREAFAELPAGSKLFYAVVVTGRFIRLEICTNQLSFTASCQCVRLSHPL